MHRLQGLGEGVGASACKARAARSILLVDDDKIVLLTLSYMLKKTDPDLAVITADNGHEAVDLLAICCFDMVVTDLFMPEMDGFSLIRYLAEHRPTTPVLAMTGSPLYAVQGRLADLGVSKCLEKGTDARQLADDILGALKDGKHQTSSRHTVALRDAQDGKDPIAAPGASAAAK